MWAGVSVYIALVPLRSTSARLIHFFFLTCPLVCGSAAGMRSPPQDNTLHRYSPHQRAARRLHTNNVSLTFMRCAVSDFH